jgi:polyhydroxybutyrate depolymerase
MGYKYLFILKTRSMFFISILLMILLLLCSCSYKKTAYQDRPNSINYGGLERTYIIHIPQNYDKKTPIPLVLNFHGGGGNSENQEKASGMNNASDKYGFIVVYPQGTGKIVAGKIIATWNAGRCCGNAVKNNIDDVGYISALIDKLEKSFNIDKKRIYATGWSNGGQMSYRLGCELSEKIAAISSVGSNGTLDVCKPVRPVPIFQIDGTLDTCSPIKGGICGGCFANFFKSIGMPIENTEYDCYSDTEYLKFWQNINNCSPTPKIDKNKAMTCISAANCKNNADVRFCTIEGMGHTWPGGNYGIENCTTNPDGYVCKQWKKTLGPLNKEINANDLIWDFFQKHPLK